LKKRGMDRWIFQKTKGLKKGGVSGRYSNFNVTGGGVGGGGGGGGGGF